MSMLRRSIELSIAQDIYYAEFPLSETPYIATVDADEEFITICNPRGTELHLKDYYVVDRKRLHKFIFTEDDHIIQPHGTLYLYTCPKLTIEHGKTFRDPHVLWRNVDGSLRRKEVLNNEHCEMLLYAPNHKCIASCSSDRFGRHEIKRREEELHSLPSLTFPVMTRTMLSFLRILFLIAFAICALENHPYRLYLYWGAFFLDLLSRDRENNNTINASLDENNHNSTGENSQSNTTSSSPQHSVSFRLLRALSCYGDDINLFILYISAIMYENNNFVVSSVLHPQASPVSKETEGLGSNDMNFMSVLFQLFHTSTVENAGNSMQIPSAIHSYGGSPVEDIAWHRIFFIFAALLEFTAITASTDALHWRREEDVLYRWVRCWLHPVGVTVIALGSEIYLLTFAHQAQSGGGWAWWLVVACFVLRVMNNITVVFSCLTSSPPGPK